MNQTPEMSRVRIKGVKDGLHFLLDDSSEWDLVIKELEHKLKKTHQHFLSGVRTNVYVYLGQRELSTEMSDQIHKTISYQSNLKIQSIHSEKTVSQESSIAKPHIRIERGFIRSGQTLQYECDVLFLGDINPGGSILSSGNIYIMGSLRGVAHAGMWGNESAMIMASYFKPTQLRIARIISRPPDEWSDEDYFMECAYIHEGQIEIEKVHRLHQLKYKPLYSILQVIH